MCEIFNNSFYKEKLHNCFTEVPLNSDNTIYDLDLPPKHKFRIIDGESKCMFGYKQIVNSIRIYDMIRSYKTDGNVYIGILDNRKWEDVEDFDMPF